MGKLLSKANRPTKGYDVCSCTTSANYSIFFRETTGYWLLLHSDLAGGYPNAHITGTDLSPTKPTFVPPTCRFEIGMFAQTRCIRATILISSMGVLCTALWMTGRNSKRKETQRAPGAEGKRKEKERKKLTQTLQTRKDGSTN